MTHVLDNLSRLTLVMPTYKRQEFALRSMRYWSGRGPTVRVFDGSPEPISTPLLEGLGDNIIYKHDSRSTYERGRAIPPDIDTEYVTLICDDEFFIPSALSACIDELDQNEKLVACCGLCLAFNAQGGTVIGMEQYPKLAGYALLQADPVERACAHMKDYVPSLVFAISRRSAWTTAFNAIFKKEFQTFAIGELQFEISLSFAGKSMVLPQLMWLRSHGETPPIRGTNPGIDEKSPRFPSWWHDPQMAEEKEEFLQIMAITLETLNPTPGCDYRQAVIAACESYNEFFANHQNNYPKRLLGFPYGTTLLDAATAMGATGVQIDWDALKEIEQIVHDFSMTSLLRPPQTAYPGITLNLTKHLAKTPTWAAYCLPFIKKYYHNHPDATDIYARMGYHYLTQKYFNHADQWFQRELDQGRMGWWMRLRHAEVYAEMGLMDQAKEMVKTTYANYADAVDGYAMLALRMKDKISPHEALILIDQDQQCGRLSPDFAVHHAQFLAQDKQWTAAIETLERGYRERAELRDGFLLLAQIKRDLDDADEAFRLATRDALANRLSSHGQVEYAQLIAARGQYDQACALVQQAYDKDDSLMDGFTRCAIAALNQNHISIAVTFVAYRQDVDQKRSTDTGKSLLIESLDVSLNT